MKKCNTCGTILDEQDVVCRTCGSNDVAIVEDVEAPQPIDMTAMPDINDNGNVITGIVGAFLFSIIGGVLYFILYQFGFIAGICGFVMFALAKYGYGLFAKTKNKNSTAGLVSAIVSTILMIFLAEYFCLSFEIYSMYTSEGYDITILDAVFNTPLFLEDSEIKKAVLVDLLIAYGLSFVATIRDIMEIVKARKQSVN